jgi:hypothetical protein
MNFQIQAVQCHPKTIILPHVLLIIKYYLNFKKKIQNNKINIYIYIYIYMGWLATLKGGWGGLASRDDLALGVNQPPTIYKLNEFIFNSVVA